MHSKRKGTGKAPLPEGSRTIEIQIYVEEDWLKSAILPDKDARRLSLRGVENLKTGFSCN
jgi:hypothetical protein